MYGGENDIFFEVYLDGAPFTIKASNFDKGVQVLLMIAGVKTGETLKLFEGEMREKVREIVLRYLLENAEKAEGAGKIKFSHIEENDKLLQVFFKDKRRTYIWTPKWSDVRHLYEQAVLFELVHHGLNTEEAEKFRRHCRRICRILKRVIKP